MMQQALLVGSVTRDVLRVFVSAEQSDNGRLTAGKHIQGFRQESRFKQSQW